MNTTPSAASIIYGGNTTITNSTFPNRKGPKFDVNFHLTLTAIAFLIILTNGLVLVLFRSGRLWRTKSNYLLLSLSISDMVTGIVAIPLNIYCECTLRWNTCLLSFEINRFIGISTINHILLLTLEKYLAVMHPLLHRRILTKNKVTIAVATTWLVSLLIALIPLEWLLDLGNVRKRFAKRLRKKQTIHESFVFVTVFLLPLIIMIACYMRMLIFIAIHNFSSPGKRAKDPTPRNVSRYRRFKPILLFLVMLIIYILSWGWWYFGTIQRANWDKIPPIPELARSILILVRYSSSFLNPLLYTFFKRDFKFAIKRLLTRSICHSSNSTSVQINMDRIRDRNGSGKKVSPLRPTGNKESPPCEEQNWIAPVVKNLLKARVAFPVFWEWVNAYESQVALAFYYEGKRMYCWHGHRALSLFQPENFRPQILSLSIAQPYEKFCCIEDTDTG